MLLGCRQGGDRGALISWLCLPEMLRVKKCWVASELDVATVRDDHYPVVVDLETFVCLPKTGKRKATKLCALRLRNQECREAFQKDLEGSQGGTPCKHAVWAEKTLDLLADLDPHGLCQSSAQSDENGV